MKVLLVEDDKGNNRLVEKGMQKNFITSPLAEEG